MTGFYAFSGGGGGGWGLATQRRDGEFLDQTKSIDISWFSEWDGMYFIWFVIDIVVVVAIFC